jgi:F-type H+-transporting ATPase subunit epsilon
MKKNQLEVKILSEEGEIYKGLCQGVIVPSEEGSIAILPFHTSMIAVLGKGEVKILLPEGSKVVDQIDSGVVHVSKNKAVVLSNL